MDDALANLIAAIRYAMVTYMPMGPLTQEQTAHREAMRSGSLATLDEPAYCCDDYPCMCG